MRDSITNTQQIDKSMVLSKEVMVMLESRGCDLDEMIFTVAAILFQLHYTRSKLLEEHCLITRNNTYFVDQMKSNIHRYEEVVSNLICRMKEIDDHITSDYQVNMRVNPNTLFGS